MKNIYQEQNFSGKWFANKHKLMWTQHVGKDHKEEILVGEFGFLPNQQIWFFLFTKSNKEEEELFLQYQDKY